MKKNDALKHLLCIDFETFIFEKNINAQKLNDRELIKLDNNYAIDSLEKTLGILKKHDQKVTFFVVMKLEKLFPGFIDRILKDGHEVGWHGYEHNDLDNRETLIRELDLSKKYLKKHNIKGFQAPRIVFFKDGYSLLKKYGFVYSSSIYGNSQTIYTFDDVHEIPVSTSRYNYRPKPEDISFPSHMSIQNVMKFGIPFGSSYFWSLLGKHYYTRQFRQSHKNSRILNIFIHNWQLFPTAQSNLLQNTAIHRFIKNPAFYPYTVNVLHLFEEVLANFYFQPCINYIYEKKGLSYTD